MKIAYIANVRLPTERAHGIQIIKMCEAFTASGVEVELFIPKRKNAITEDIFEYYGVKKKNFKIKKLFCLDFASWGRVGFKIKELTFAISIFFYFTIHSADVLFTRDEVVAFLLSLIKRKVVWEGHQGQDNFFTRQLSFLKVKVVVISQGLRDFYLQRGIKEKDILVMPDGVDLSQFNINISKSEARNKIGLPQDKKIILYSGHLYNWKGADVLAEAGISLGDDCLIVFVGGTKEEIALFRNKYRQYPNIKFIGKKPHYDIPYYLKSADLLILPNSGKEVISRLYTSPLKLFEYMASGVPIIASDLASLREIVDENNVILVNPDDPENLALTIKRVLPNNELLNQVAEAALKKVSLYTWQNRAQKIIDYVKKN